MKVLILKPSSLGDVIQALPVLRLLKRHRPDAQIFWWIASELAPILEGDADLAGLFHFTRRGWATPEALAQLVRDVHRMRRSRFDLVIDLQGLARSGVFSWLARGRLTVGVDDRREGAGTFYDIRVPRPSEETHAVDWYLSVLAALDVPVHHDFDWIPERPGIADLVHAKWRARAARWLLLNPGARWPNKRWPAEYFVQLAQKLLTEFPEFHLAILGTESDFTLGDRIAQLNRERCCNLAGQTSLPEMIEWIRFCELIVTNDTGPMHVAAALRKPVVAIFGPTNPHRTGPYGQINETLRIPLPCSPCLKNFCVNPISLQCLWELRPEAVFERVRQRLPGGKPA